MIIKRREFIERKPNLIPDVLSILGGIIYGVQSLYYAMFQLPLMDEGAYLFKGYQFAIGNYIPFQPYGFWTNKMYFPFYIWGWIQSVFQPGLMAPRLFAVFFGLLTLLGTWIVIRRMGNRWLAAVAILVIAFNPNLISIYSLAISQVLVICMLTWILVFILGSNRPIWMIGLGSVLAALMIFTRENMIFVIPFLVIYIFWQHGKKMGLITLGSMSLILIIGHLIFWPEITYIWSRWLPNIQGLFTRNSTSTVDPASTRGGNMELILSRAHSVAIALRIFLVPLLSSFTVLLLWPQKGQWQSRSHRKATLFLGVTFAILLVSHLYASIGMDYCVYCATNYFSFFGNLGLIFFSTAFYSLNRTANLFQKLIYGILTPILFALVGFSLFEEVGISLNNIMVPRFRDGKILSGTTKLWQMLSNKFGMELETSRRLLPAIFGLFIGVILITIIFLISRAILRKKKKSYFLGSISILLLIILVFSPFMDALPSQSLCKVNVPDLYSSMAREVNPKIPDGSRVYLDGNLSTIPLLNLENVKIYPPQINSYYSFKTVVRNDTGLINGFWNAELEKKWKLESDIFIIGADRMYAWREYLYQYVLMYDSTKMNPGACPNSSAIYIYSRPN